MSCRGPVVYAIGGTDALDAQLFMVPLCAPETATRVTSAHRYSTIDSSGQDVVVSTGRFGADTVERLTSDGLMPLLGREQVQGLWPVTDGRRVAFATLDDNPRRPFALHVVRATKNRVSFRSPFALGPLAFERDGGIVAAENPPEVPGQSGSASTSYITVISAAGRGSRVQVSKSFINGVAITNGGELAWSTEAGEVQVAATTNGTPRLIARGWRILDASPTTDDLLVANNAGRLAVLSVGGQNRLERVAQLPFGKVFEGAYAP